MHTPGGCGAGFQEKLEFPKLPEEPLLMYNKEAQSVMSCVSSV